MFLTRWLATPARTPKARRAARHTRLGVERLDDRCVPAVLTVTTTADVIDPNDGVLSLREAVIRANASNETDTIAVPAGTYTLSVAGADEDAAHTGDLDVAGHVKIQGAGAGATVIDGAGLDRVFHVLAGADVSLAGLTVRGGFADGGGGILNGGVLSLDGCTVSGNAAGLAGTDGAGGGILNGSSGKLTIRSSTISGNSSGYWGGGIANFGQLSASGTVFADDTADSYGGALLSSGTTASADIDRCSFTGDSAGQGGGVFTDQASLSVSWSTFSGNAGGDIGASGVTPRLQNDTFA